MSKRGRDDEPGEMPEDFMEDELPREETGERIKRALSEGAVEVSEERGNHTFVQQARHDTGDDAWESSVHANRRAPGHVDPEPEPAPAAGGAPHRTPAPAEPAAPPPDLHAIGSVDTNNPIQFIDDPLGLGLAGPDEGSAPAPPPSSGNAFFGDDEPEEPVAFLDSPDEPVPFIDGPPPQTLEEPIGGAGFFGGAPQPPTEEVPSAIFDDVSQPSSIPSMSRGFGYQEVAAPVQEEIVIGAPTPPPAVREHQPGDEGMPDLRKRLAAQREARIADADDEDDAGLPVVPILILAFLLLAVAGSGWFVWRLAAGPDMEHAEKVAISGSVQTPGTVPIPALPDVMVGSERVIPGATDLVDPLERPPEPGAEGAPAPAPDARTGGRSKPKPKAKAEPTAAITSRISVTSNRRVLIQLDGVPQGYAPLEIRVVPGTYTLSAALPNRPDSQQTKTVEIGKNANQSVGFVF